MNYKYLIYGIAYLLIFAVIQVNTSNNLIQRSSPINMTRAEVIWKWCDCGQGIKNVTIWPSFSKIQNITVSSGSIQWIKFKDNVKFISWTCDGMKSSHKFSINLSKQQSLSLLNYSQNKTQANSKCGKLTGRLSFNIWNKTDYISSVPFTSHTEGYACFKIPTLLKTNAGTLIAFSEARSPGCDDFDRTELVYKRSFDNGKTWSHLSKLVQQDSSLGECGHKLVIGNISPIQLQNNQKYPNRILAPYTRNNFKLWIIHSDDDGQTWQGNRQIPNVSQTRDHPDCNRNMSYFGYNIDQIKLRNFPDMVRYFKFVCSMKNPFNQPQWREKLKGPWQFIGVGPSQSIQLRNGRILVPGYHSPIRGLSQVPNTIPVSQLYNNFAKGFVLISDDFGDTWRTGKQWPTGQGTNQHQLVQLDDGTILSNSRSLSTGSPQFRLQSKSFTQGQTFMSSEFTSIPQPFAGCQGSTIGGKGGKIYVISPNPKKGKSILQYLTNLLGCRINLNGREKLSLWQSRDSGKTYQLKKQIDPYLSAQTSLQYTKGKLYLLYEQADMLPSTAQGNLVTELIQNLRVLIPSRFIYRQIDIS